MLLRRSLRYALWMRRVRLRAFRRGAIGGDRWWQLLFRLMILRRVWVSITHPAPEVLSVEKLTPGQSVIVRALGPRSER
jgi:hypothetical protein